MTTAPKQDGAIDLSSILHAERIRAVTAVLPETGVETQIATYRRLERRSRDIVPRTQHCWAPNKPSLVFDGRATWAEFIIVALLTKAGWDACWLKNWGTGLEFCREVDHPTRLGPVATATFDRIHAKAPHLKGAGSWDVLATREEEVLFVESKQSHSSDRLNANQLGWLEAAMTVGIPATRFAIVEYLAPREPIT